MNERFQIQQGFVSMPVKPGGGPSGLSSIAAEHYNLESDHQFAGLLESGHPFRFSCPLAVAERRVEVTSASKQYDHRFCSVSYRTSSDVAFV